MCIGRAVAQRIENLCAQRGITINRLGIISGITQSTLSGIVNEKTKSPTVSTIKKICDGLEISIVQFFDSPEFHSLEQEIR